MKNGIRRRLITLFIIASVIEVMLMLSITFSLWVSSRSLSASYSSNLNLIEFEKTAEKVHANLEDYVHDKSYQTMNSYLKNKATLKRMAGDLNPRLSGAELSMGEYTVYRFTESFLAYADSTVFKWRGGDLEDAAENYRRAEKAYSLLSSSISRLDNLYFKDNIGRFSRLRELTERLSVRGTLVVVTVSLMVLVILFVLVSNITQPLKDISEGANQLAQRNFDIPLFKYNEEDEIGSICRAFNRMIISIREYIDTIWEKAIQENEMREKEMKMTELYQEARLEVLQSQINPHFLFNTINTGAQLAMMEGSDRTCDFLEKVADFYRYNLQFTGNESVLKDEISMLDSYVYIMKVRFGDKFNYEKQIESGHLDAALPGMILQPLVENSIKHGFKEISKGGKILLKVQDEPNAVVITVSDNGCGISEMKRKELLAGASEKNMDSVINSDKNDSGTGVGVVNVISRLKLFYKTDDVFDISASESGGTKITIRIKL